MSDKCQKCGCENTPDKHCVHYEIPAASSLAAMPGSAAAQARITAIKEVRYICDEALDHDTGWAMFCELVQRRLALEASFIEMAKTQPPNADLSGSRREKP